jgi:hypothetical protein
MEWRVKKSGMVDFLMKNDEKIDFGRTQRSKVLGISVMVDSLLRKRRRMDPAVKTVGKNSVIINILIENGNKCFSFMFCCYIDQEKSQWFEFLPAGSVHSRFSRRFLIGKLTTIQYMPTN